MKTPKGELQISKYAFIYPVVYSSTFSKERHKNAVTQPEMKLFFFAIFDLRKGEIRNRYRTVSARDSSTRRYLLYPEGLVSWTWSWTCVMSWTWICFLFGIIRNFVDSIFEVFFDPCAKFFF